LHDAGNQGYEVRYATGYTVKRHADYTEVNVRDPWDTLKYLQRYVLIQREKPVPTLLPEGTVVKVPLRKVAVAAAVHCSILEMLGLGETITGVCESRYIRIEAIHQGIKEGKIIDIGEAAAPDVERFVELAPDAMITSPLNNSPYGGLDKTGIPQIKCVDYMEASPLGRAEWIRFLGLFTGKEHVADSIFNVIVAEYEAALKLTLNVANHPTVITEKRYGSTWWVAGGKSYIANMFRDAAVDYYWYDDNHTGSLPLSFETVFENAHNADYWLIRYNQNKDMTYSDLQNEYMPYSRFAAYQNRRIFACNTAKVAYYEEVAARPDYLLKDFIKIFHPQLLPNYELRYYKPME
jgi:iron complex transport system substrate-binding protein